MLNVSGVYTRTYTRGSTGTTTTYHYPSTWVVVSV